MTDLPTLIRELDARLDDDPTAVLVQLDEALGQPPSSLGELQEVMSALAWLAGRWVGRARGLLAEAEPHVGRDAALFLVDPSIDPDRLADPVQAVIDAAVVRSDGLAGSGRLQEAMDALLLGGAIAGRAGAFDDGPLVSALARLEERFGVDAVDGALDASWVARVPSGEGEG